MMKTTSDILQITCSRVNQNTNLLCFVPTWGRSWASGHSLFGHRCRSMLLVRAQENKDFQEVGLFSCKKCRCVSFCASS